ncbi:MAG: bifunctional diaminohydroxyphosphoribosylaminopyrimidine deaminase/5-amino-6-(5-phosphoribosylamino)uracil reductase RibD [Flavobacteriales bacterium]|nr:bifunctional diaminohydroxyphosphoribosylaminopyrimidine deaminase/5-amino-6-(5-phosphoribosylamino)uracil reductase RibD [Flavobacteriales bacterium]
MLRAIDLAHQGTRDVFPNPKVGCVIVKNGKIIGEGFHQKFGGHHAEVNAVNSVQNKDEIHGASLYVTLEPCSFVGKTPSCATMLTKFNLKEVCVGAMDPNPKVSGSGIEILRKAGIKVTTNILESDCLSINKFFNCLHLKKRPYITLKWAESQDGFIDRKRNANEVPSKISNVTTDLWVQRLRFENHAIMVGTNTIIMDDPKLTQRYTKGSDPIRITIDSNGKLLEDYKFFDEGRKIVVGNSVHRDAENLKVNTKSLLDMLLGLGVKGISSVMIEGGSKLLHSFINSNLWDEAVRIKNRDIYIEEGVSAPKIRGEITEELNFGSDHIEIYKNMQAK